jgi:hypothetical protein
MPPGAGQTLWCVAKPTVPDPIIQEAMDYACGSGAECDSILPSGACYRPNTVLAHASFAFNSYWQQAKANGGTCDFGGTATIVTRDPSKHRHQLPHLQCFHAVVDLPGLTFASCQSCSNSKMLFGLY